MNAFRDGCQSYGLSRIDEIDAKAKDLSGDELTAYLTKESIATGNEISHRTHLLLSSLIRQTLLSSKYQYEMGDNL